MLGIIMLVLFYVFICIIIPLKLWIAEDIPELKIYNHPERFGNGWHDDWDYETISSTIW